MPPAEAPTFAPQVCWDPAVQRYMEAVFGAEHLARMQARGCGLSRMLPANVCLVASSLLTAITGSTRPHIRITGKAVSICCESLAVPRPIDATSAHPCHLNLLPCRILQTCTVLVPNHAPAPKPWIHSPTQPRFTGLLLHLPGLKRCRCGCCVSHITGHSHPSGYGLAVAQAALARPPLSSCLRINPLRTTAEVSISFPCSMERPKACAAV